MSKEASKSEIKEARQCMALGAGVGALGAITGAISGALCPICFIVAPALVGAGLLKERKVRKAARKKKADSPDSSNTP